MSFGLVHYRMQKRQVDCRCPWSLRCPLDRRVVCGGDITTMRAESGER